MLESNTEMDERLKPRRFKNERLGHSYVPAEGSWESLLLGIRDEFPESVHVVGEGAYFVDTDARATMTLAQACFQYYLAGKGHRTMAEMVVDSSESIRGGAISAEMRKKVIDGLASKLYEKYPDAYKLQVKK